MSINRWEHSRVVKVLDHISQPAAPFREELVEARIFEILEPMIADLSIQCFKDRYGNIVVQWMKA